MFRLIAANRSILLGFTTNSQGWVLCGFAARMAEATNDRGPAPSSDSVFQSCHGSYAGPCPLLNTPLLKARQTVPPITTIAIPDPASFKNFSDGLSSYLFPG
jgi:hypothetical protein